MTSARATGGAPAREYWRHDPRLDPPTKADRRRLLGWVAFLSLTPICLAVVVWAALGLNGNYPTVAPPGSRRLASGAGYIRQLLGAQELDAPAVHERCRGRHLLLGAGGGVGESVTAVTSAPRPTALPAIVGTYLTSRYVVVARDGLQIRNATKAWRYTFRLTDGATGLGVLAWVKPTQSRGLAGGGARFADHSEGAGDAHPGRLTGGPWPAAFLAASGQLRLQVARRPGSRHRMTKACSLPLQRAQHSAKRAKEASHWLTR